MPGRARRQPSLHPPRREEAFARRRYLTRPKLKLVIEAKTRASTVEIRGVTPTDKARAPSGMVKAVPGPVPGAEAAQGAGSQWVSSEITGIGA